MSVITSKVIAFPNGGQGPFAWDWVVTSNATIISGQGTDTITVESTSTSIEQITASCVIRDQTNPLGNEVFTSSFRHMHADLTAAFTFTQPVSNGPLVHFTNTSQNATNWVWTILSPQSVNVTYVYDKDLPSQNFPPGVTSVTLATRNRFGDTAITAPTSINVGISGNKIAGLTEVQAGACQL